MAGTLDHINMPRYCGHCGLYHSVPVCPNIKKIEYHPDGSIKSVEYREPPSVYVQQEQKP